MFRSAYIWTYIPFVFALLFFVVGLLLSSYVAGNIDAANRVDLMTRVQTIAMLTNRSDVAELSGTDQDLVLPAYDRLKKTLYDLHSVNGGARFLYFQRSNATNDKLIFLVDSEDPASKDYSPPGQVYEETSPLEMKNYLDAVSFTEGPYEDSWGSWVSGYAPVWWQGKVVGIFGMDISALSWRAQIFSYRFILIAISLLVGAAFVILGLYIRNSISCIAAIDKVNVELEEEKKKNNSTS